MALTSAFCLMQEALQRDRARGALLENARFIATQAANAWRHEATLARKREAKHGRLGVLPPAGSLSEVIEDRMLSENPDRGLSS